MNKAELIAKLADDAGITKTQANASLDSFIEAVTKTLKGGGKVTLVGFGTFSVSKRAARNGRNQLLMDIMEKVAKKHNFEVLLHEKPFAGINGSGKHNNWSIITNTGVNLLSPGSTPMNNLQFLTFFVNIINRYILAVCYP